MATEMLHAGVPIPIVSRRLDYRRISTTLDFYAHATPAATASPPKRCATNSADDLDTTLAPLPSPSLFKAAPGPYCINRRCRVTMSAPRCNEPLDLEVKVKVYPDVMASGLKIKDVAAASGFTAATLRYYEQIGLLPESSRTPAGYRTYDERTVERLAFIARAKQLGCTLEEITGLTTAWDGGQCGPIQDRLRQLVAVKIAAAQSQIGELMTFTSELQTAASVLERHRPDGACDGDCGCVSDNSDHATSAAIIRAVSLSTKPARDGEAPIACTLAAGSMKGRIADWQALLAHVERREPVDGGVRCVFAASVPTSQLITLVAAEQDCCQFFEFAITVDTRGVALEVRAPIDALPIVTSMFGTPL